MPLAALADPFGREPSRTDVTPSPERAPTSLKDVSYFLCYFQKYESVSSFMASAKSHPLVEHVRIRCSAATSSPRRMFVSTSSYLPIFSVTENAPSDCSALPAGGKSPTNSTAKKFY